MRFIDRYAIDHPGVLFDENGAALDYLIGCPWACGYETREESNVMCRPHSCAKCWEREIDEERDLVLDDDFCPWGFDEC